MIADVAHQPGALPLLQYALTELFERRDEDRLTLAAYQELGGITGALSARAERIFEAMDQQGRRATQAGLLALGHPWRGAARTPGAASPAVNSTPSTWTRRRSTMVVDTFGRHRLLTFDREPSTREPTVEIAHEALLTRLGAAANVDRRRAGGPPSGARPGAGGRRVARLRRRPELPHPRCPTGPGRDLGGRDGPGDRATRACLPEGERRRAGARAERAGCAACDQEGQLERRSRFRLRALVGRPGGGHHRGHLADALRGRTGAEGHAMRRA